MCTTASADLCIAVNVATTRRVGVAADKSFEERERPHQKSAWSLAWTLKRVLFLSYQCHSVFILELLQKPESEVFAKDGPPLQNSVA